MTPRENALAVLRHEKPEWVPLMTHVDNWNRPAPTPVPEPMRASLADNGWGDGPTIELGDYLGIDLCDWTPNPVRHTSSHCAEEWKKEGNESHHIIHTPLGDLVETTRFTDDRSLCYKTRHLVNEPEDIARFAAYLEDQTLSVDDRLLALIRKRRERIGERGIMPVPMSGTPLGMLVRIHSGPEAVAYLLADADDEMRTLFDVMERKHREEAELLLQHTPCEALIGMDDTSTTTISPRLFETYCMDYTDRMADLVHSFGPDRFYWHHSCGLIRDLLPLYRRTRMNCVHTFTTPPVGNARLADGVRDFAGAIAMHAALPSLVETSMPWDEREREVREFFAEAGDGRNLIVGLWCYQHLTVEDMARYRDLCRTYDPILNRG